MKAKGPKLERETIVRWDETSDQASIWTVYRKLLRLGYAPTEDNERSASFDVPKRSSKSTVFQSEARDWRGE